MHRFRSVAKPMIAMLEEMLAGCVAVDRPD
jgi:hypothetical protein